MFQCYAEGKYHSFFRTLRQRLGPCLKVAKSTDCATPDLQFVVMLLLLF